MPFQGKSPVTPKKITYGCTQLLNAGEFLGQVRRTRGYSYDNLR